MFAASSLAACQEVGPSLYVKCRYTLYVQAARRFAEAMGWKYCECPSKPPYNILQRLAGWIDACADNIHEAAFPEEFREWYNIAEDQFATKTCIARERAFRCFASRTHELTFALAGAGLCRLVFAWLLQAEPGRYLNSLLEGRRDMVGIHDRQVLNFQLVSIQLLCSTHCCPLSPRDVAASNGAPEMFLQRLPYCHHGGS